ncbi:MAG TPA: metallophosphoesterase [Roseiarcus sp.]|nr:metallophosphoesterase [Roseiarcus sp.]
MKSLSFAQQVPITRQVTVLRDAAQANPALAAQTSGIWTGLQQSEAKLIALMNGQQPPDSAPGKFEQGPLLYMLHHPPDWLAPVLDPLLKLLDVPPTKITDADIQRWEKTIEGPGVVASDGTLVSDVKYATFDPDWILSVFDYLYYYIFFPDQKVAFRTTPARLKPKGDSLTVAILGDWGTGVWQDGSQPACPSQLVMQNLQKSSPDIAIHLGDVYYTGALGGELLPPEEADNFVKLWPSFPLSLTLNSNHEMYDGGNGYFKVALESGTFKNQAKTSYFSIEFGNWVIFGLDSAYYDTSILVMDGAIKDSDQLNFISTFDLTDKKVMVLTHHNGLSTDGTVITSLWNDVYAALGNRNPDYWYWGHIHDGVVYAQQTATGNILARCAGHGALPFGDAYGLHDKQGNPVPSVVYYAHTRLSSDDPRQKNRVLNGYAVLKFTTDSVTETFYDQTGSKAWTSAPSS